MQRLIGTPHVRQVHLADQAGRFAAVPRFVLDSLDELFVRVALDHREATTPPLAAHHLRRVELERRLLRRLARLGALVQSLEVPLQFVLNPHAFVVV